jgi:ring-1,2-phenylacetyl-CoA epoxidase subunit PaaD
MVKPVDELRAARAIGGDPALESAVRAALASVHDPEIPPLSIVDLGIVERVEVAGDTIRVHLLPTFAGCPALDAIQQDVLRAIAAVAPGKAVEVRFVYSPPWTSDRITEAGRRALTAYGLTPPTGSGPVRLSLGGLRGPARCPFCGSDDTHLESAFGPTLCRSVHFCRACRNPFEAFKPKLPR